MDAVDTPTVFISHSAKEPEAALALSALADRLRAAGLGVWLDRERLAAAPGVVWRQEIAKSLHLCRAAIVLLSPSALASPWVRKETAVLAHRHDVAPTFQLIPLLVGGTTPEDLDGTDWEPMAVSELQALAVAEGGQPPDAVVARLAPLLDRHPPDSFERRLENHLVQQLKAIHPSTLASAAHRVELAFTDWDHDEDRPTAYARRLLEVPFERQADSLELVADADPATARRVLHAAAPHGWIVAEAAAAIRGVAVGEPGRRGIALNTAQRETCEMYVRAGFFDWQALQVEGGLSESDAEEVVDRARACLLGWLGDLGESADVAELDAEIDEALETAASDLPFLVLPPEASMPGVLGDLRRRWPNAPVMLRCGADTEEQFARRALEHFTYVHPPVDATRETEVLALRGRALRSFLRRARAAG